MIFLSLRHLSQREDVMSVKGAEDKRALRQRPRRKWDAVNANFMRYHRHSPRLHAISMTVDLTPENSTN